MIHKVEEYVLSEAMSIAINQAKRNNTDTVWRSTAEEWRRRAHEYEYDIDISKDKIDKLNQTCERQGKEILKLMKKLRKANKRIHKDE